MPELRYNLVSGDWVVFAPERATRPDHHPLPPSRLGDRAAEPDCPFCPGSQATAAETMRLPAGADWHVRSVLNRFPALRAEGSVERLGQGYTKSMSGFGRHEVIIECPRHNTTTALLPVEHIDEILRVFCERMRAFYADPAVEHVIIFKNHGEAAGSSLDHPHAQIVGVPVRPGQVRMRIEEAMRHWGQQGDCVFCYCLREELKNRARLIVESEHFAAFVPYAALSPYHVWILPKRHGAYFGDINDTERAAFARILKEVLGRLFVALDNPHFNYVIRSLSPSERDVKYFHWYATIIVRVARMAGFELGTGMFINTVLPETSAQVLREVQLTGLPGSLP
jgi:UDPglucose--hexose-1-phosphate uridylyltransferase